MKYYLNVNGTEYKNVSALQIAQKYRAESIKQNLSGGYLIDRMGDEKITITATLNALTDEELTALRAAVAAISCEVIFDRGATRTTKTMRVVPFTEPSPIYYYGDIDKGIIYSAVRLTMEEM